MKNTNHNTISEKKRGICFHEGKLYFTKQVERKIFFFLTIVMLILGIASYTGIFN